MNHTINSYIETVTNPVGRFRTLERAFALTGPDGRLLFCNGSYTANFEIEWNAAAYTLKCPIGPGDRTAAYRRLCTQLATLHTPFLAPISYLEREMTLFDSSGMPCQVDVILQHRPQGAPFDRFVAECNRRGARESLSACIGSLRDIIEWEIASGFSHRNLKAGNLIVIPAGNCTMINPDFARLEHDTRDNLPLLTFAVTALAAACIPERYSAFWREILRKRYNAVPELEQLRTAALRLNIDPVAEAVELLAACRHTPAPSTRTADCIARLAAFDTALFERMGAHIHDDRAARQSAPSFSRIADLSKYKSIGQENEGIINVETFDPQRPFLYIDCYGNQVVEGRFDHAESFNEGRAVVIIDGRRALIDKEGAFVMPPEFEDMSWDSYHNLVTAQKEGMWGLFDRDGRQIIDYRYDWMGDCDCGMIEVGIGRKYGYVSADGLRSIPLVYDQVYSFRDGIALVELDGREFRIDLQGNPVGE